MLIIEAVEYLSLRGNSGLPLAATITPDPGQGSGTPQKKRQEVCQNRKMGRSAVTEPNTASHCCHQDRVAINICTRLDPSSRIKEVCTRPHP